ncbi:indole-3-glycerol-phosphate synthase [Fervidobacterium thailandense]|uniref:indole-3-glycerol-phosphate synthase n=1 Tax=Fervidobacterium thailandense TaxID=1008305 RepID=A0A1E3G1I4_9BACT|nr:indole-3-glycerol-phosphate synthase [Fervidobacterium thailandense]ODN30010.1 hypothetical protein A4H02_07475 [Fervidobacterium thailandense]
MDFLERVRLEKEQLYVRASPGRFYKSFSQRGTCGVIAEFKRRSPSEGPLLQEVTCGAKGTPDDVRQVLADYERAGASAVSILTDTPRFDGSLEDLKMARTATSLPILRKDFIVSSRQLCESILYGADCVLLIAEMLEKEQLQKLAYFAYELGLDLLIELHELESYEKLKDLSVPYVLGVNSRNLRTLQVSHTHTLEVVKKLPSDIPLVVESGVKRLEDLEPYLPYKPSGFLIGTYLLKSSDRVKTLRELVAFLARARK